MIKTTLGVTCLTLVILVTVFSLVFVINFMRKL